MKKDIGLTQVIPLNSYKQEGESKILVQKHGFADINHPRTQ